METPQLPSEERQAVQQVPLQETDPVKETHVSESKTLSSDATDADGNVSSSQQTWEYNELLRQYYELEEKSRNVLQQLQQTTGIIKHPDMLLQPNSSKFLLIVPQLQILTHPPLNPHAATGMFPWYLSPAVQLANQVNVLLVCRLVVAAAYH